MLAAPWAACRYRRNNPYQGADALSGIPVGSPWRRIPPVHREDLESRETTISLRISEHFEDLNRTNRNVFMPFNYNCHNFFKKNQLNSTTSVMMAFWGKPGSDGVSSRNQQKHYGKATEFSSIPAATINAFKIPPPTLPPVARLGQNKCSFPRKLLEDSENPSSTEEYKPVKCITSKGKCITCDHSFF